jgi:hypothetical protein
VPPEIDKAAFTGAPAPGGLSAEEKNAYDRLIFYAVGREVNTFAVSERRRWRYVP